jgi:hypothetical protein
MEFVTVIVWLVLAGTAVFLLPGTIMVPGAALMVLAGVGGLAGGVLFIVLDAPGWAAWLQVGLAALGVAGATIAAGYLCSADDITGSSLEEVEASVVGLQLPFLATVLFAALLIAAHGVDPVV